MEKPLKAGAIAMVTLVKNPISLARKVLEKTNHVLLCGYGALKLAKEFGLELEDEPYFITNHQVEEFKNANAKETEHDLLKKQKHGTVGAVALDEYGNVAAATSTGGTPNSLPGRVGDSCIIGAGCYANNQTCAVSATVMASILSPALLQVRSRCTWSLPEQIFSKHVIMCYWNEIKTLRAIWA
jgi:beta-aspartyl-peptidase (threonine type)